MPTSSVLDPRPDEALISATRAGDTDAFAELYRRHHDSAGRTAGAMSRTRSDAEDAVADAFMRVLRALRAGSGPDQAFRPYLLTTVRHVCYDRTARRGRESPTASIDDAAGAGEPQHAPGADDANDPDRALVLEAFRRLPERWQTVLWHLDVEGETPIDVASILGLAPNAVSALAYRAREGLRQEFINVHLRSTTDEACYECRSALGGYVRSKLCAREQARIERHLDECTECHDLLPEIRDLNQLLRSAMVPAILGISPAALARRSTWLRRRRRPSRLQASAIAVVGVVLAVVAVASALDRDDATSRTAPSSRDTAPGAAAVEVAPADETSSSPSTISVVDPVEPAPSVSIAGTAGTAAAAAPGVATSASRSVDLGVAPRPSDSPTSEAAVPESSTPELAPVAPESPTTVASAPAPDVTLDDTTVPSTVRNTTTPDTTAPDTTTPVTSTAPTTATSTTLVFDEPVTVRVGRSDVHDGVVVVRARRDTRAVDVYVAASIELVSDGAWDCEERFPARWHCTTNGVEEGVLEVSLGPVRDDMVAFAIGPRTSASN